MTRNFFFVSSGLLALIANSVMGFFVYAQNKRNPLYIKFAAFSLSIAFWAAGSFFSNFFHSPTSLWALRISYAFGCFLPSFFLSFVYCLLYPGEGRAKKVQFSLNILSGIFSILAFSSLFIKDLRKVGNWDFFVSDPGPAYYAFFVYFCVIVAYALAILLKGMKGASDKKLNQLKYVFVAYLIGMIAGIEYFLSVFGLLNRPPLDDYILVATFSLLTYAIARHQLMDIEVVIKKTAVFAGLFAFVYGVFAIVTATSQSLINESLRWSPQISLLITVAVITFSLRPLEVFLTNATERFLFQKKYDYRQLLRTFSDEILTILDLQKLMDQTVLQLTKIMKLESACVLLQDKDTKVYKTIASSGLKDKDVSFLPGDHLITILREGHHPILKDKTAEQIEGDGVLKSDFKKIRAQLCLPIMLHDELIGVLALGMKKSGGDYLPEDIDILSTLARTEAIAISNAQLFDELSKTQAEAAQREKMAVIGTLAAGINHEICNPLGIVRGQCEMFLLNMRDGLYKDKTPEQLIQISSDIMSKVIKETDRATGITKKLSSFAKPSKKSESEDVSVKNEVDEILGLLGHDLKLSNIEFRHNLPADFPDIFVDRKQFQEVLFNIIRNAAQAMDKKSGYIAIDGFVENGFAAVRISDNGMGIPQDKINQIFNPFYTTKAPGKGTGLGLFIVKQVVERNKGTIQVDSVEGEGTTFTLRFPPAEKLAAA